MGSGDRDPKGGQKATSAHLTQVANSCPDTWQVTGKGGDTCVLRSPFLPECLGITPLLPYLLGVGGGNAKMFVCFIKEGGPVGMLESILTSQISILSGIGWTQKTLMGRK